MQAGDVVIVMNHNTYDLDYLVGQADTVSNDGTSLRLACDVVGEGEEVQKYLKYSRKKVKFQASIGADPNPERIEFIEAGVKVVVNGREFVGPLSVVRACTLRECSVLLLGADANTSAAIAAKALLEGPIMPQGTTTTPAGAAGSAAAPANGAAGNDPTQGVQAGLQQPANPQTEPRMPATPPAPPAPPVQAQNPVIPVNAGGDGASQTPAGFDYGLLAQAIIDRSGPNAVEALRAGRQQAPAGHVHTPPAHTEKLLVAAMCMNGGLPNLEKRFDAQTLEAAYEIRREVGLTQLIVNAARANGCPVSGHKITLENAEEILAYAFPPRVQGSFSTSNLSNVLSATYNKYVLEGYEEDDDPWEEITSTKPLDDFKETNGVFLFGDFTFEKVGATGNIAHGKLSDEIRKLKADLYAKHIQVPLTALINDDLGMLGDLGFMLGAGGKEALISAIWTEFQKDNATSYEVRTPHADNAFSLAALRLAHTAAKSFKDPSGKEIVGNHRALILPTALELTGEEFMTSKEIRVTTSNKEYVTTNVMAGKYRVVSSRKLTSDSTWWTAGGRKTLNPMQAGFVGNKRMPTVESAVADFQTLGLQFRGHWGFAVGKGLKHSAYRMATA
jgi:hypothetical protein